MKEIWKDIKGYEGKYQVSNQGKVRILKEMTLQSNKNGYLTVNLYKNSKSKRKLVHRLVAEAFIINENNKPYINHKDTNKKNNNINNLEWCTPKENIQYSIKYGNNKNLFKRLEKIRETKKKKINQYDLQGNFIKQWNSMSEATNYFSKSSSGAISNCCSGRNKTAYGYKWEYAKEMRTNV